jgi:hypothetical protein
VRRKSAGWDVDYMDTILRRTGRDGSSDSPADVSPELWFDVSENAYNLCHPVEMQPEPAETTAAPQVAPIRRWSF